MNALILLGGFFIYLFQFIFLFKIKQNEGDVFTTKNICFYNIKYNHI